MRTIIAFLFAAIALITTSCSKQKNEVKDDYIIVGRVGGIAGISDYRLINNGQLRKDTVHLMLRATQIPISQLQFDVVLPDSSYQKVAHLKGSIPPELLAQNNKQFGEHYPDAMGLLIYTTINGTRYQWSFIGDLSKTSTAIQKFAADAEKAFY